tara:strand:+ start:88 stop:684 length:597 start_codon:yes stop_codon:yes gene_type:complete
VPLDRSDPIVRNFIRLSKDAFLLQQHQRHQSAYALALIAAEEVAKLTIERWEELRFSPISRLKTWHLTKQLVFAALNQASSIAPLIIEKADEKDGGGEGTVSTAELMAAINDAWRRSRHHEAYLQSYNELWERAKHRALYADQDDDSDPSPDWSEADSRYLLDSIGDAIMNMADVRILACAYILYEHSVEQRKTEGAG